MRSTAFNAEGPHFSLPPPNQMKRAAPSDGGAPPAKRVTKAQALLDEKVAEAVEKAKAEALLAQDAAKKALEDTLQCGVCLSLVFEPVTSACGHAACFECLAGVVRATPPDLNPLCPTCRKPIERLQSKWCVNSGLVKTLEVNNGPGYRGQVNTIKFHTLIREDKPLLALMCLNEGGVDLTKSLRLPKGISMPPLYYALEKNTAEWGEIAFEMINKGADLNSGLGALDFSKNPHTSLRLIEKGATKCSSKAFLSCSNWMQYFFHDNSVNEIDEVLVAILSLVPKPLSKLDQKLQQGLFNVLLLGHAKSAVALLKAGIPLDEDYFKKNSALHLAASQGLLDAVKLIHARDPDSIYKTSAEGATPLHIACLHGKAKVALYLIKSGCGAKDKKVHDQYGRLPVYYAGQWARKGDKEMRAVEEKLKELF